jgi:hypothetical protein
MLQVGLLLLGDILMTVQRSIVDGLVGSHCC